MTRPSVRPRLVMCVQYLHTYCMLMQYSPFTSVVGQRRCHDVQVYGPLRSITQHGSLNRSRKSVWRRVADWENLMQCSLPVMKVLFTVKLSNVLSLWPTREIVRKGQQQGKKCMNTSESVLPLFLLLSFSHQLRTTTQGLKSFPSLVTLKIKTWWRSVCREQLGESYPLNPRSMFPYLFAAETQWCHHFCTFSLLLLPPVPLPLYPSTPHHAASHLFLIATWESVVWAAVKMSTSTMHPLLGNYELCLLEYSISNSRVHLRTSPIAFQME